MMAEKVCCAGMKHLGSCDSSCELECCLTFEVGAEAGEQGRGGLMAERPLPWDSWLPESERAPAEAWEAVPDTDWRLQDGSPCRRGSPRYGYCGKPSVAALRRGKQNRWWAYCPEHMYNRWVEGEQVLIWRMKPRAAGSPVMEWNAVRADD